MVTEEFSHPVFRRAANFPTGYMVRLAPLTDDHVARYLSLSSDPELIATMGWRPFAAGEAVRYYRSLAALTVPGCDASEVIVFSVLDTADGTPLGYVCLKGITPARRTAELGIALMDAARRGGGRGTEALKLALEYAFNELDLTTVALTVFTDNYRAIRAYQKVGFEARELLPASWRLPDGTLVDQRLMKCRRDA